MEAELKLLQKEFHQFAKSHFDSLEVWPLVDSYKHFVPQEQKLGKSKFFERHPKFMSYPIQIHQQRDFFGYAQFELGDLNQKLIFASLEMELRNSCAHCWPVLRDNQ